MCAICGCSTGAKARVGRPGEDPLPDAMHAHLHMSGEAHDHAHGHDHDHDHPHPHTHSHAQAESEPASRLARLEIDLLAKNDRLAAANRSWFGERGILALNLIGSPGSGKTTLLEQTARRLAGEPPISVLEGDQETDADARRIRAAGCRAVQINTGAGCHLDAGMVADGLRHLGPEKHSIVFIENVGNLVCPALFDLGERAKVVVLSVTEGEDKPLKYPHIFRAAEVLVLTKIDLLPHLSFDVERCLLNALRVKPGLRVFRVSASQGEGIESWCAWLRAQVGRPAPAAGEQPWRR